MSTPHDYEDKIAKLLAKAEAKGSTPEESEALTAAAERLMVKYAIDRATIEARRSSGPAEQIVTVQVRFDGSYHQGLASMAHRVVRGLGNLQSYGYGGLGGKFSLIAVVGFESDVAQAKLLIESLHLQAAVAMTAWWKGYKNGDGVWLSSMEQFKSRRQFFISFGSGVEERLERARRSATVEAEASAPGTELVLVSRKTAVDKFVEDNTKLHKSRGVQGGTRGAAEAGRNAGRNANTGGTAVGNGSRAIGR